MSHPEFGLAWDIEVKHETANENVETFPTSQNMSHPEFGVTWDIEVKHETANENFEIISYYESFQYVRQPFIDCLSILTHAARTRQDSKQNHMASGYPLGYHDAIWHPRARIQDIIKTYPHLNI